MSTRILLLGSGGREHALAWKLSRSDLLEKLFVCPGNGGTSGEPNTINVDISPTDFPLLVDFAIQNEINLVVPGPEQPLVEGIEAHFRKVGIPVFGPSFLAARMEGSKVFSKAFMDRHNIPTAAFKTFKSHQLEEAEKYVKTCGHKVVLKASGLAAGKGVLIPQSIDETMIGLRELMVDKVFGAAGDEVVIEEYLSGPEISVLAFSDGYSVVPLPAAQDHKRIGEGDVGLNTGGMGAYAPAPVATSFIMDHIIKKVLKPTIDGMRREGYPFVGLLFTGLILTSSGPKVLEYNVRFGDPETEALMLLLSEDTDLVSILMACAERHLDSVKVDIRAGFAVSVVLASEGYPSNYVKGRQIEFGPIPSNVVVFHAGTAISESGAVTAGGRVLAVTAHAATIQEALHLAYSAVDAITFKGKIFRRDIARRAPQENEIARAKLTYARAGVSVDAGNDLVQIIKPYVRATRRPGADVEIGGFGGIFDLKAINYVDPVLVSSTDGVGTKLRIALDMGIHDLVGIDLVAMSVNDLLVQGAEPLYFLDYFACGKLDTSVTAQVVKGVAEGCRQAGCGLIGGETAEMPGMYSNGDYDLAGFAVGAVERQLMLPRSNIAVGDILLGIASSGLHSNGFSLVREIISIFGLNYRSACPWRDNTTLGRALLEPTTIYISQVLPVAKAGLIKGMSHITGGGFVENIPRVLPDGLGCYINAQSWTLPQVFRFLMSQGDIEPQEMTRTFNNGIGMVVIVAPCNLDIALENLRKGQSAVYQIGEVTAKSGVEMRNLESWTRRV